MWREKNKWVKQSYGLNDKITAIMLSPDGFEADISSSQPRPYKVTIKLDHYTHEEWTMVLTVLSKEALFEASLLNGVMPAQLEPILNSGHIVLYPRDLNEWISTCTCQGTMPCKHAAAVFNLLGESLKQDPLVIFELRGLPPELLMNKIRETRFSRIQQDGFHGPTEQLASDEYMEADLLVSDEPIHAVLKPSGINYSFQMPPQDAMILSTVREPDFWKRDISLRRLLSPIYQSVSQKAVLIVDTHSNKSIGDKPS